MNTSAIRLARACAIVIGSLLCSTCGGSPMSPSGPGEQPVVMDRSTPPQLVCPYASSPTSRTYYVAINEPGADNERCDGSSPVNAGNGRCPFKDFTSARTFGLLRNVAGVRVEVRAGVYTFVNEGLSVLGTGNDESSRVVLTAYQNEPVVFDGRNAVREVIRLSGRFTTLERVTVRNAAAYNVQVGGGTDHVIQCTRFLANLASDSLKGLDGATRTLVRHNDFSGWDSQAIDMTNVSDWTIQDNDFHDPKDATGNAIGAKFGARNIAMIDNRFRNTRGIAFGGTSTAHADDYEAYNLTAQRNSFENVGGAIVRFYSCSNCVFSDNTAKSVGGGFVLGGEQLDGPSGCAGGCRPTRGATITRNRLTDLRGSPPNTFWGVYRQELTGLSAGGNLYCTPPNQDGRFRVDGVDLTFTDWIRVAATDSSSSTARSDSGACATW